MSKKKLHNQKPKSSGKRSIKKKQAMQGGTCRRKIGYGKREAYKVREQLGDMTLVVYKCRFCDKHHLGHK